MAPVRTFWHFALTIMLRRYGPSWFEVQDEVPLSKERPRIDYLLLRKVPDPPSVGPECALQGLWSRLARVTVVEYKSVAWSYRPRDLDQLWAYVHAYWVSAPKELRMRDDLGALLLMPRRTPSLMADARAMELTWKDLDNGYWELSGGLFGMHVVELDVVSEREGDDLVGSFGHGTARSARARNFWVEQIGTKETEMSIQEMEGYDEALRRLLEGLPPEQRLAGLAPEQRLAGLAPEQRLAGLPPEQRLLAMPDEALRVLPEEYLATLPEATQEAIRKRLGR